MRKLSVQWVQRLFTPENKSSRGTTSEQYFSISVFFVFPNLIRMWISSTPRRPTLQTSRKRSFRMEHTLVKGVELKELYVDK